jgi:hypothetical protein
MIFGTNDDFGLLQHIRVKLVGKLIVTTAAMDDVPWLDIVGKQDHPLTARTTDFFQYNCDKVVTLCPQPEGKASSERAVDNVAISCTLSEGELSAAFRASDRGHRILQPQKPLKFPSVKPDNDFPVYYNDRSSPAAHLLNELFHRCRILGDIAICERNFVM